MERDETAQVASCRLPGISNQWELAGSEDVTPTRLQRQECFPTQYFSPVQARFQLIHVLQHVDVWMTCKWRDHELRQKARRHSPRSACRRRDGSRSAIGVDVICPCQRRRGVRITQHPQPYVHLAIGHGLCHSPSSVGSRFSLHGRVQIRYVYHAPTSPRAAVASFGW